MPEILHVTPVMPVDEHHIEYALDKASYAGSLITSWIPTPREHGLLRMVPALRRSLRREPVRLRVRKVERHFWPDMRRSMDLMLGIHPSTLLAHDAFFERVDRHAENRVSPETRVVVGREFGCRHAFMRARQTGASCVYHLPTVHHETLRGILESEQAQFPGVCRSTFDPLEFQPGRLRNKQEEIAMADLIICPSAFVRETMLEAGVSHARTAVVPFGCEQSWIDEKRKPSSNTFLFVGNISARKGAHRLLKAWKALGAHKLHRLVMVGDMHLSPAFLHDHAGIFQHIPRMPREDLRDLYLSADALVLPALAEGFALVILEALSCGTAVLASRNSGAEGFLTDGVDGRLYDAQDDSALRHALEWALNHPEDLEQLGRRGREKARLWSWRAFEKQFMTAIEPVLNTSTVDGSYLKR